MVDEKSLKALDARIKTMKAAAEELKAMAGDFPALYRNSSRILASIKMLELSVSDLLDQGIVS
ncbi:MAG: hypothetical protein JXL84_22500 [Deltaproteobacteria bacterium]|nr:hypothetical protein [Deltaproteobacteria bacterium]